MRGMIRAGRVASVLAILVMFAACASRSAAELPLLTPEGAADTFVPTPGAPFDPPPGPPPSPAAGPVGMDGSEGAHPDVLARINGQPILKAELAEYLCISDPQQAYLLLDNIVKMRVLRAEAKRLEVTAPEAQVEKELAREMADLGKIAEKAGRPLDEFLKHRFGLSRESYCAIERSRVRYVLTRERVVRYSHMLDDCVHGKIIVIADREEAEKAVAQIRQGADFGEVARQQSLHRSNRIGGRLPPIGRWGVQPDLEERLFTLRPGEVSDPMPYAEADGRETWFILKCVRFAPARRVAYAAAAEEIEKDLVKRPFHPLELDGWRASLGRRYNVQYLLDADKLDLLEGKKR